MNRAFVVLLGMIWLTLMFLQLTVASDNTQGATPHKRCKVYKSYQIRGHFTVKGDPADREQRKILARGLNQASRNCSSRNVSLALVIALIRESSAHNLPYGHSSSVGVLQLLDSHGSFAWRMVPSNSMGWFLRGADKINTSRLKPGQIADAIERPRDKGLYTAYLPEARIIYARWMESTI